MPAYVARYITRAVAPRAHKLATLVFCAALVHVGLRAQAAASWLDRPLANWNVVPAEIPHPPDADESRLDLSRRCALPKRRATASERALGDAGWLPYDHLDRKIAQGDVEIIAALVSADGMCRPVDFNLFVFVAGKLAGTLSPVPMASREDGAAGAVRLGGDGTISAEFARYLNSDALCCPSGRVGVRYHIDRTGPHPLVVPTAIRQIR